MLWAARMALAGAMFAGISTSALGAHPEQSAASHGASSPAQNDSQDGQWLAVDQRQGCRALDVNFDDGDTVSWTGDCRNGFAEGAGTLTFSNDGAVVETITANLRRGIVQNGHVAVAWSDGSKYEGDETGGHMNGMGVFTSAKGDRLEGPWTNDVLSGRVQIAWADGDRYDGDWHDGAANGQGTEIWANGDRYDGDWRDGKAEGTGSQKWADGRAYSGAWHNDQPMQAVARSGAPSSSVAMAASSAPSPAAAPQSAGAMTTGSANVALAAASTPAKLITQAAPAVTQAPPVALATNTARATGAAAPATLPATLVASSANRPANAAGQSAILDGLTGTQLVSVDGSSIAFTATEAGFTREIARPDGARQATSFNFINDRLGTITSAEDPSQTTGLFRVTDSEIDVNYADGRSEVLTPNRNGGLSIALAAPNAGVYCMSWYPQGHMFSDTERKAAVAAYASRLGAGATSSSGGTCADGPAAKTAAAPAAPPPSQASTTNLQNVPRPIPKPMRVSFVTQSPWRAQPAPFAQNTSGVVVVRDSVVHPIDADADASIPVSVQASLAPAKLPDSASDCLTVDSDGAHWGFRNHCSTSVQFAYCVMNDPNGLAGCHDGGVAGSVAPNGFGALVADQSIKETGGDHDFRWIACSGGAGEVVPHLDRADPPTGRCVRPKAS